MCQKAFLRRFPWYMVHQKLFLSRNKFSEDHDPYVIREGFLEVILVMVIVL